MKKLLMVMGIILAALLGGCDPVSDPSARRVVELEKWDYNPDLLPGFDFAIRFDGTVKNNGNRKVRVTVRAKVWREKEKPLDFESLFPVLTKARTYTFEPGQRGTVKIIFDQAEFGKISEYDKFEFEIVSARWAK